MEPRRMESQILAQGRFLQLSLLHYQDALGTRRSWESADRVGDAQAVYLLALLNPSDRLVLVRQYRPAVGGYVLEFPAGLVDADEEPAVAALRELREETGYHGRVLAVHPAVCSTPGLSSESVYPVLVEIDERDPANFTPVAEPDDGESIEVILVSRRELTKLIQERSTLGDWIDAKVSAVALGEWLGFAL